VYEFSRNFRNEGIDATHNPEFTMIEIYEAYRDYNDYMDLTRELVLAANAAAGNGDTIAWGEKEIQIGGEWPRISMKDLFRKHADLDIESSAEDLRAYAKKHHLEVPENATWGVLVDEIFSEKVEPNLISPIFVTDYPVDISPLAKKHRDNPKFTERFELYIAGREMANGFSELNDPIDQRERFESQERNKDAGDAEAHPIDEDFLTAQEYGMPPTAGVGIGIDRLVMLLTNKENIREVILFPQLRS
jgi:lysyl-tRNA synthetase, class II